MTAGHDDRLSALDEVLDSALSGSGRSGVLGAIADVVAGPQSVDPGAVAGDLFAVVDALEASPALRRAVTDPGTPEEARRNLVGALLSGKVSEPAARLVAEAATRRWAGGRTFAAALERQAVRAELARAERAGQLDETEDELFRFARVVESNPDLRNALADRSAGLDERQALVGRLLEGKATRSTVALARRAVVARERTFANTIEGYVTLAAALRNRVVATVRVAQPLAEDQRERLRAGLTAQFGRDVTIQELVDPTVLGGVRVELGNEVIEGTVAGRMDEARRLFS